VPEPKNPAQNGAEQQSNHKKRASFGDSDKHHHEDGCHHEKTHRVTSPLTSATLALGHKMLGLWLP